MLKNYNPPTTSEEPAEGRRVVGGSESSPDKSGLAPKIQQDLKGAVKNKRELQSSVLRMVLAAILNEEKKKRYKLVTRKPELGDYNPPAASSHPDKSGWAPEIEKESQLTDEETIEVISSEIKKRKEAIFEYEKGQRPELAEKEKKELEILQKYMPEPLSEKMLRKLAKEAIEKVGAKGPQDMGKVMGQLMPQVKGRAEGGGVQRLVKELLTPQ